MTDPVIFDERIAAADAAGNDMHRPEVVTPAVEFLAELAGTGRALEFGVGTGRIALPLHERGVDVSGVDVSPHMLAELRRKPGGDAVGAIVGDMATCRVAGEFTLVYAVWNSFINLLSQEAQVACFQNAAAHLLPLGRFVVETGFPADLPPLQTTRVFTFGPDRLGIDEWDVTTQQMTSHHHWKHEGRWDTWAAPCRYVWPAELDLMGRISGLELRGRWANWQKQPFTKDCDSHVSVWQKRHAT